MAEFPGNTLIDSPVSLRNTLSARLTALYPVRDADAHEILSGVQYELDYCGFDTTNSEVDFNDFDDCIRTAAKVFDEGLLFVESFPLGALYAALTCRPGFGTGGLGEYEGRAERRLRGLETSYLELKLEEYVLEGTNATLVTSGANLQESIAALVNQNIDNPTLHISVETAVLLGEYLQNITLAGIALVVSPVYATDSAFLTGAVTIWGGDIEVRAVPDPETNYIMALAERQYIMAVEPTSLDCKPFKVVLP
jgi:hypothetical protein